MADSPRETLLEARNLLRLSRDGAVLLDVAGLRVAAGERWGVTGPTGAGKTLLLRALALLDPLDSGEVCWQGRPIPDSEVPAFRRRVIYLQQRPALIEGTVETNLKLPLSFRANQTIFDRDRCLELLAVLGLDGSFLDRNAKDLSGGEAQITAILRAVQLEPSVLLLDEPTAALDAHAAARVEQIIDRWIQAAAELRAVVWVTHDAAQCERVCERQLRLEGGRIAE